MAGMFLLPQPALPRMLPRVLPIMRLLALVLTASLCAGVANAATQAATQAATLDVAWWKDGAVQTRQLRQGGGAAPAFDGAREVPLGSLWKLFVYVYAVDSKTAMPDMRCGGRDPDEVYCCEPGQTIARDAALAQSCGLFFTPARLKLEAAAWRAYWTQRLGAAPGASLEGARSWLADPAILTPGRLVRLDSLLQALASVSPGSRAEAESALLRVVLDGHGAESVRWFGSQLRVKTFSWHGTHGNDRVGGAAGWLADGTPVWFSGAGASSAIFQRWARPLAAALPQAAPEDSGCVVVDFFTRYPVRSVQGEHGPAQAGSLQGRYRVQFENGQTIALRSNGDMLLERDGEGRLRIAGRFGVNEYVARVIDREAGAAETEAARAFVIAARSYLQQNARQVAGCQHITDSSATQRVSPNPAGSAALAVARWTDQLIIDGVTVRYHRDMAAPNTLSWRDAVAQSKQGRHFDELLAAAYPSGALATAGYGGQRCVRLEKNEAWLARELPRWQRALRGEAGYEAPQQPPVVCTLAAGAPYSEQSRNRIFMRPLATREDRITLAHEYLHLGLRRHPRGQDEGYVERLARRLTDLKLEGQ